MSGRWLVLLLCVAGCDDLVFGPQAAPPLSQEGIEGVREIADGQCMGCHSAQAAFGQLDLQTDLYGALVGAPDSTGQGILVDPGSPDTSVFYLKITNQQATGTDMPPGTGGLPTEASDLVKRWIEDGAPEEPVE
jgi:uncharacterized membrane protein